MATKSTKHLIRRINLKTSCRLEELEKFYRDTLGLETSSNDKQLVVMAGSSEIAFDYQDDGKSKPFYHFAFNIPENKIKLAHDWQAERTDLIPTPEHMRDRAFPDTVRHFVNWNAHSVFFYDPAGNILEYIARHDLKNAVQGSFSQKDMLCVSEIAFVANDVPQMAMDIKKTYGLTQYKNSSENFHVIGDENGLILVFKKGRDAGTGDGKTFEVFPAHVDIHIQTRYEHPDLPYSILSN